MLAKASRCYGTQQNLFLIKKTALKIHVYNALLSNDLIASVLSDFMHIIVTLYHSSISLEDSWE